MPYSIHTRATGRRFWTSRRRVPPALLLVAASTSALLSGCVDNWVSSSRSIDRTVEGTAVGTLKVDSHNGSVTVTEDGMATGVVVHADIKAFAATTEEAAARAQAAVLVAERDASGNVSVHVDFPAPKNGRDSASIDIRVPSVKALELESGNGAVTVTGLAGPLKADTSNGAVEVAKHDGALTLETSNGRIVVTDAGGAVSAKTSNGRIEIALASGNGANVDASTSNGAVTIDLPSTWQGSISAQTSNGKVDLETPAVQITQSDPKGAKTTADASTGRTRTSGRSNASTAVGNPSAANATVRSSNGSIKVNVKSP